MNVLLISNDYPPHRWAGTETYTAGIADQLRIRGHLIHVICKGSWEKGIKYWNGCTDDTYHSIPVRRLNVNWAKAPDPFGYLYYNPVVADYLANYLNEIQPDLIHVTSCETLSASVIQVVKNKGVPMVLSLTDFWFLCPRSNLIKSDGSICDGVTTPWQCLRCQLFNSKLYRWPNIFFSDKTISYLLTKLCKYPFITRQRGFRGWAGNMENRKGYLRQAITWPDIRITASPFVRDIFQANGIQAPFIVQSYGHDLTWLTEYAGKTSSDTFRIGFIGQISGYKGVHLLIEATNIIQDRFNHKLILYIYGNMRHDINYSNSLRQLAKDRSNIQFCGTYPHEHSAKVFADIDVLVVPSIWYDFPLIIYEAFATKTPVIATNLGGMAEAVQHEVNGLLFERGNINDLAKQIMRIINDPGLLDKLQKGIPPVKQMSEEVDELEQIYESIVQHSPNYLIRVSKELSPT